MRRSVLGWGAAFVLALLAPAATTSLAAPVSETKIVDFQPAIPPGPQIVGNCWTSSIATNRPDAYRCMRANEIFDPCFTTEKTNIVVCDPNPALGKPGFALHLSKPLPAGTPLPGPVTPWLVALTDGYICTPFTGTRERIHKQIIAYGCAKPGVAPPASGPYTGLVGGTMTHGRVWRVQKAVYVGGPMGNVTGTLATVSIATVWR
jgi:hypothetical protein